MRSPARAADGVGIELEIGGAVVRIGAHTSEAQIRRKHSVRAALL